MTTDNNPFKLQKEEYKRSIDVLTMYVKDQARNLSLMTGDPLEQCTEFVKTQLRPGGMFEFKDPAITFLERGENEDRSRQMGTLAAYLAESVKNEELISPTLTTYLNPKVRKSILVDYIDANVKRRGVAKKAMFKAKMEKNYTLAMIKDNEQTNAKLANNAISGAHVSPSTPLYNKTAHSTLTSNCRTTSGYGNANNEKYLCGNRHYRNPHIIRNNIISIINNTDLVEMERVMQMYNIRIPTINETMDCIRYSGGLYFRDERDYAKLNVLVCKLSDIERAAFVYTGDLYQLMLLNDEVIRVFIGRLSSRITTPIENQDEFMKNAPEDNVNLAAQICASETRGVRLPDLQKNSPELYGIVAATTANIGKVIEDYAPMIRSFWVSINVPASVAYFPDSIRRSAITSDTDSTIFTVQDWVIWYNKGRLGFDPVSNSVAATVVFLAAQTITHVLGIMSANFGIETKRIHQVAMKNEYMFAAFIATQVAKHYYASITCQEGNVFETPGKEIKGVHLKSSNAPREMIKAATTMMEHIMNTIMAEGQISIVEILDTIGNLEKGVLNSIAKGSHQYFRMAQVKQAESYTKGPTESNYAYYTMWNEVFGPKYGYVQPPPYMCVRITTDLKSPRATQDWLDNMKDQDLAERLRDWLDVSGKKYFGSFYLPEQIVAMNGIPEEILACIDARKITHAATSVFYIILESLGVFMLDKKLTKLVSDYHYTSA
jgi:hypothetical protein